MSGERRARRESSADARDPMTGQAQPTVARLRLVPHVYALCPLWYIIVGLINILFFMKISCPTFQQSRFVFVSLTAAIVFCIASIAAAAITFVSYSHATSNDVTITDVTVGMPASTVAGNLLLANISVNGGSQATVTAPSGWTQILSTDNDTNVSTISYYKIASASEPSSYTWTVDHHTTAEGEISQYSGIDTSNPIDSATGNIGFGTIATTSTLTTSASNENIVTLFAVDVGKTSNAGAYFTTPDGMTERYDLSNTPYGPSSASDDVIQAAAGASRSYSPTIGGNKPRNWVAQQIALRKPSGIAFDNATTYQSSGPAMTVHSFNHTVSGTNRVLFVSLNDASGQYGDDLTSVTYDGVPMTRVAVMGTYPYKWLYVLFNPSVGTHAVVMTFGNTEGVWAIATSYTGAANTGSATAGLDDVQTITNDNVSTITESTTPVSAGDWAITMQSNDQALAFEGPGINAVRGYTDGTFLDTFGDSNGPVSAGVPYSMTWDNHAVLAQMSMTIVSLIPAQ
jgi:hypothetical protein